MLAKTNQIFQLPSKIAVNSDVASEDNLVADLEAYGCLLLTGTGIDRSQIQIQPVEHRVAVGGLAFFDDLAIQLLEQQHARPARTFPVESSFRDAPVAINEMISSCGRGGSLVKIACGESSVP